MLGPLFLLMTLVPFIEIYFLLNIGKQIGAMNTFAVIIFTGILGAWFLKRQGAAVMAEVQSKMGENQLPADALLKGVLTLLGGILLLTPGFLTDALGFSLVLPPTQTLWKSFFGHKIQRGIASGNFHVYTSAPKGRYRADRARDVESPRNVGDGTVIDIKAKSKTDTPS